MYKLQAILTRATKLECFLVGAFSLKEKSPTITVGGFFSFSAYNLTLHGPLFLQSLFVFQLIL